MKRKALSILLSSAIAMSVVACGSSEGAETVTNETVQDSTRATQTTGEAKESDSSASEETYKLDKIRMVVNGTFLTEDVGQADFVKKWNEYVSEKMGYPIELEVQQIDHSGYYDGVGRLFASGDYPDVILLSSDMIKQYAATGIFWDMAEASDLVQTGNRFFTEHCKDAPVSPMSETYTNEAGTIYDAKMAAVSSVVVEGGDVDAAMQKYQDTVGAIIEQCLDELNSQN